ncbi:MAG: NAD+ synthase [Phycisphaerales bacterium]|nr:NAD+ synthase [Phycisphaerales bacterium]
MRLALAQINPTVGDIPGNAQRIADFIEQARAASADAIVLPELALCGYPPKDLLLAGGFMRACIDAARQLGEKHTRGITAIFGCPLPAGGPGQSDAGGTRIANSLLAYRDGRLLDYYDKRLLPTYDVFDEHRYFTPGDRAVVIDIPTRAGPAIRAGLSICEDLWKGKDAGFAHRYNDRDDPVPGLITAGAQIVLNPSASPFVLGKGRRHREILASHATRHRVFVAAVNQVGGNDDLLFDGHAALLDPDGRLIAAGPGFREALTVIDLPLDGARAGESPDPVATTPAEHQLFEALVMGVRDYCRKTGFKSAIIGLSGGIDSAVTAAIAVAALGSDNVLGVAMPGHYSSEHSRSDAYDLARRLGMRCITIPIDPPVDGFREVLDPAFDSMEKRRLGVQLPDLTEENLQSRARGTILMGLSNRTGAIVLTTGNKSELAVGYCTLYGDMNGGLAVLSDVTKQLVYALARHMNTAHRDCGFAVQPIPESSITKPPSAELRPDQKDQDSLPPYDELDRIIAMYVEGHRTPAEIIREAGLDPAVVAKVVRLIDLSEYKRRQAATGLKVTSVAFGTGRRFPIAQRFSPPMG